MGTRQKRGYNAAQSWGDENHPKTGFKLIPFSLLIA
jgi:hypothetical protein